MSSIILDTDVASLIFKKQLPASLSARLTGRPNFITFATLGELTRWGVTGRWGWRRREALAQHLAHTTFLAGDNEVARVWGRISGRAMLRGRTRPENDTWIAACCLAYDLPLATLNLKDFADFAEHEGLNIVGG